MPESVHLILLVEAEPMLRLTMSKFLRRSGYEVTACPDAAAAEAALVPGTMHPSLILLGVRVLDRQTASAAWRLREAAPDTPILGIADALQHDGGEGPALPANLRFLAHPFDMPDVLRAVRSSLRHSGQHSAIEQEA